MTEPTQEQKKELLEWCGARVYNSGSVFTFDNGQGGFSIAFWAPTLDFLFKYAVSKLTKKSPLLLWLIRLTQDWAEGRDTDPALALFWALYKVMEASK